MKTGWPLNGQPSIIYLMKGEIAVKNGEYYSSNIRNIWYANFDI